MTIIETILAWGENLNTQNNNAHTLLRLATIHRHAAFVNVFLKKGTTIDVSNNDGHTPSASR